MIFNLRHVVMLLASAGTAICFLSKPLPLPSILNFLNFTGSTIHHQLQTQLEITSFLSTYFSLDFGPNTTKIPANILNARQIIMNANAEVDDPDGRYYSPDGRLKEKDWGAAHFHDESFDEGQDRLVMLRGEMIEFLQEGDVEMARIWLGRQLHALQDFYAHSNWVEQDPERTDISDVIGVPGAQIYGKAAQNTCSEYCLDTENMNPKLVDEYLDDLSCYRGCFQGDDSMWDVGLGAVCGAIRCMSTDDICMADQHHKVNEKGQVAACEFNMVNFGEITTGYFINANNSISVKPAGRCSHGGLFDNGTLGTEGINKDTEIKLFAPHWFLHEKAAELSRKATQQYLQHLTQDWGNVSLRNGTLTSQPALTDRELRMLFGVGSSTLAFIIGAPFAMSGIIFDIREAVIDIVQGLQGTDGESEAYMLTTESYAHPKVVSSADGFIDALDKLSASDEGFLPCSEPNLDAIVATLEAVASNSHVFIFSSFLASSKDDHIDKQTEAMDLAQSKHIQVTIFQFPSNCSTAEADSSIYEIIAGQSGGSHVHLSDAEDIAGLVRITTEEVAPDIVGLYNEFTFSEGNSSAQNNDKSQTRTTSISVDSTIRTLYFQFFGPSEVGILCADQTQYFCHLEDDCHTFQWPNYTFIAIDNPLPGFWTFNRSNGDSTSIRVSASSYIIFHDFQFVELKGSHPAWFPITDTIEPRRIYDVLAYVSGSFSYESATFQFRSRKTGNVLTEFDLDCFTGEEGVAVPDERVWHGEVEIPYGAFYVMVVGTDHEGYEFHRSLPGVYGKVGNEEIE